jgi:hypothetical protein
MWEGETHEDLVGFAFVDDVGEDREIGAKPDEMLELHQPSLTAGVASGLIDRCEPLLKGTQEVDNVVSLELRKHLGESVTFSVLLLRLL